MEAENFEILPFQGRMQMLPSQLHLAQEEPAVLARSSGPCFCVALLSVQ